MTKTKVDIVVALADTFNRKLTDPALKLYVAAISSLSDDEAKTAAGVALQRCKFFPTAAELIEYSRTGGVSHESRAVIAFDELDVALTNNNPEKLPPLTRAILRQIGGFQAMRNIELSQFYAFKRKDFLTAYASLARENPARLAEIAGPSSELALALNLKRIPSAVEEADRKRIEENANRKRLLSLPKSQT